MDELEETKKERWLGCPEDPLGFSFPHLLAPHCLVLTLNHLTGTRYLVSLFLFIAMCTLRGDIFYPLLQQLLEVLVMLLCCLVAQSCPTLQPHGLEPARLPCPLSSPGVCSNSCPLSRWCHPTISSSFALLILLALNLSQHQCLFQWVSSSHQVVKGLEF